jgi:SAM-dependent methyltransferase
MKLLDRAVRKAVPSLAKLSHSRLAMLPVDSLSYLANAPFEELRSLPPNRLRVRVGVGNRVIANGLMTRYGYENFWYHLFATGAMRLDSHVLDVGSGVGGSAVFLREFGYYGTRFTGRYTGIDADREMVEWCRTHYPADRFTFEWANVYSKVYNPTGRRGEYSFPLADGSQDLVYSHSLFTHLLEDDTQNYLRQTYRVLRPGGQALHSFFVIDHLREFGRLGGRWTFAHSIGNALVENTELPEAATGYTEQWLADAAAECGFSQVRFLKDPKNGQSVLHCTR